MQYGDLRGPLEKVITLLKSIDKHTRCMVCGSGNTPLSSTSASGNPATVAAGYQTLTVTKTNASGTVTITFPDSSIYVLSADGEQFTISGLPLGVFTILAAGGATFKYYAF